MNPEPKDASAGGTISKHTVYIWNDEDIGNMSMSDAKDWP
jgi:hypothetical protein